MPARLRAKSPGEFIRDHLVNAPGQMDYCQAVFKAYKIELKSLGLNGIAKLSFYRYFWMAKKLGLIVFDHAEAPAYWDGVPDGVTMPAAYRLEKRPRAPSPRHYYRIVSAVDPKWVKLEASYRQEMGLPEVPTRVKPEEEKVVPAPRNRVLT